MRHMRHVRVDLDVRCQTAAQLCVQMVILCPVSVRVSESNRQGPGTGFFKY